MKKLFIMLLALPIIGLAQSDKNVITTTRYFPKPDKVQQFEKAVAAHAAKYHKGDVKWHVYTIESGPDVGAYMIVEGPNTWDGLDKRGDLGKAHTDDWNLNIQPLLTDKYSNHYLTFRQDLSTVIQTDYADKASINHLFYKPGYYGEMQTLIQDMKKTWEQSEQHMAVYEASSSGEPQFIIVTRYKNGLKERVAGTREPLPVRFARANGGESAWTKYLNTFKEAVSSQWSEMLFAKPAMNSKD